MNQGQRNTSQRGDCIYKGQDATLPLQFHICVYWCLFVVGVYSWLDLRLPARRLLLMIRAGVREQDNHVDLRFIPERMNRRASRTDFEAFLFQDP